MTRIGLSLLLIATAGCDRRPPPELAGGISGVLLPVPTARPSFVLTDLTGARFDFRARTAGRLTLLFFGYLNCPDVCPATMANIGAVTSKMLSAERGKVSVVFVTTDPDRDSLPRLRDWLGGFDPAIVGLTGTLAEVESAQRSAGVSIAIRDSGNEPYTVSHAAQVLVYSPDDSGHVAYPFGTRQSEWAADLPKLLDRWRP